MLCTWARDHGIVGAGIDMSALFTAQAQSRAVELGVAGQVGFIHGDAAGYVADEKVDVAACIGASWIAGGVAGTMRRWLQANPNDELANEVRTLLTTEPLRHVTYTREYLGWGVFALMAR